MRVRPESHLAMPELHLIAGLVAMLLTVAFVTQTAPRELARLRLPMALVAGIGSAVFVVATLSGTLPN